MSLSARLMDFARLVAADVKSLALRLSHLESAAASAEATPVDLQRAAVLIQTQRIAAQQIKVTP